MLRFIAKYIYLTLLLIGSPVVAEDANPLGVTFYGSFLHTDTVPNALFFFKDIERYDSFELRRALRNHDVDTVVLASDGGSVWEGLNMAGIIHDKGITTYVPKLPENMGCYSACAYMFFGGKIRKAEGTLAVHQMGSYGSDQDRSKEKVSDTQQSTQFTVSEIIGFLNEFKTPPWVYEKMFRSRDFYEFDISEKKKLSFRSGEINVQNLDEINTFIKKFIEHISEKNEEKQQTQPEISEEEEKRIFITEIQKYLNKAGCRAGKADGIWGRRTQAAAILFAKTAGLEFSSGQLISEQFINKLKSSSANICPKPKPVLVKSFARFYDAYCGRKKLQSVVEVSQVSFTARSFVWKMPGAESYVNWSGSTFTEFNGRRGKLNINKDGFVYSFTLNSKYCSNVRYVAR